MQCLLLNNFGPIIFTFQFSSARWRLSPEDLSARYLRLHLGRHIGFQHVQARGNENHDGHKSSIYKGAFHW